MNQSIQAAPVAPCNGARQSLSALRRWSLAPVNRIVASHLWQRALVCAALFLGLGAALFPGDAFAGAVGTGTVQITKLRTGWDSEQFAVETAEAYINPASCPSPDGYAALDSSPGYRTYYSAILAAISSGKKVQLIVSNSDCAMGRPRIMGVYLIP